MEITRFIGGILEANCYVISTNSNDGNQCYIIDPGYNPGKILRYLKDKGLTAEGIILTHHHYDHSEGADKISRELECPVMIHILDADRYKGRTDVYLEDGDVLNLADDKLRIIHTPGHTAGGICLYSSKSRVCFTGDTVFNVDLGRTDLEDGNQQDMINSIKNTVNLWKNDITIYPGHGDPASMKTVRKINREFREIINDN